MTIKLERLPLKFIRITNIIIIIIITTTNIIITIIIILTNIFLIIINAKIYEKLFVFSLTPLFLLLSFKICLLT